MVAPAPFLFIIESSRPEELLNGEKEGEALVAALRLARIRCRYWLAADREMLALAFARIGNELENNQARLVNHGPSFYPIIHIAAHGDADGLELTSGETVSWPALGELLDGLKAKMGIAANRPGELLLAVSACQGIYACQAMRPGGPAPYFLVFGPRVDVSWSDTLTAFLTFYHLFLEKAFSLADAIDAMNRAAGVAPLTFAAIAGEHVIGRIDR